MKSAYMLGMTAALAVGLSQVTLSAVRADNQTPSALAGQVTSDAEGAMEGVVVTAHKDGSIVSISVTTDAKGHYAFPENRLEPGHYSLAIRAVGYDLSAPAATDVVGEKTANVDLKLDKTKYLARPAHQRRMDDEHARHRRAEGACCSTARAATPWSASCARRTMPTSGCRWSPA